MTFLALLNHLINLFAPALVVGLVLALLAPLFGLGARAGWRAGVRQGVFNALTGLVGSLGGLWYFGRDAKMASYGALLLLCATAQWLGARGWRAQR